MRKKKVLATLIAVAACLTFTGVAAPSALTTTAQAAGYTGLKRISKPGLRVYAGKDNLPKVLGGLGVAILSTNQGIITDKEARKLQVGGEVLAFVW